MYAIIPFSKKKGFEEGTEEKPLLRLSTYRLKSWAFIVLTIKSPVKTIMYLFILSKSANDGYESITALYWLISSVYSNIPYHSHECVRKEEAGNPLVL
jgi:hypothetical protein